MKTEHGHCLDKLRILNSIGSESDARKRLVKLARAHEKVLFADLAVQLALSQQVGWWENKKQNPFSSLL